MKSILFMLCVAACLASGCSQDIQKEYPDYPKWGWWENRVTPSDKESSEEKTATADASPRRINEMPDRPGERSENPSPSRIGQEEAVPEIHDAVALNDYRKKCWRKVSQLQNLEDLSTRQRRQTLASIEANLPKWYKPLGLTPPDTKQKDWTLVVLWDFMPDESFFRAVKAWRSVAEEEKLPFPEPITRRALLKFVLERVSTNP